MTRSAKTSKLRFSMMWRMLSRNRWTRMRSSMLLLIGDNKSRWCRRRRRRRRCRSSCRVGYISHYCCVVSIADSRASEACKKVGIAPRASRDTRPTNDGSGFAPATPFRWRCWCWRSRRQKRGGGDKRLRLLLMMMSRGGVWSGLQYGYIVGVIVGVEGECGWAGIQ